jgi:iron(III) transport system permease protein
MSRRLSIILILAISSLFGIFFIYPIWLIVREALVSADGAPTYQFVLEVFQNRLYVEGLFNAFRMGLFTTIGCLVLAVPLALLIDRYRFPGKSWIYPALLLPLILPPFVGAIGVRQILGQMGALNVFLQTVGLQDSAAPIDWLGKGRMLGIVIMNVLHLYPILLLNVSSALNRIDPAMEEAAEGLGCFGWRRFRRITLPLAMPGIFAGSTIVFIWAFTELGVPLIFDYGRVTSVQIFHGIKEIGGNPLPFALVFILLVFSSLFYVAGKWLFGSRHTLAVVRGSDRIRHARNLGWKKGSLALLACLAVLLLAVLPHLGVVLLSCSGGWYGTILPESIVLDHYLDALGDDLVIGSIWNSCKYSTLATTADIIVGVVIAYLIVRTRIPGRRALDAMAMMPLAVPGIVLAFGYLAMTREGRLFDWMIPGGNPIIILVVAYAVRRLPYVVRSAAAGLEQTSITLEEAATNLGASPMRAFKRITLPLIAPNLIAGGLLAFAFAMLEVSDSLILAQRTEHYPITKAIYSLFGTLGNGHLLASALGVWAMIFLAITILGASLLLGRKLGGLFRY